MTTVPGNVSTSVDGYVAGPNDNPDNPLETVGNGSIPGVQWNDA